jgi:hypothetical protein
MDRDSVTNNGPEMISGMALPDDARSYGIDDVVKYIEISGCYTRCGCPYKSFQPSGSA